MNLDQLVALSVSRPQRNLHGDLGPRCHWCSGLGSVLPLTPGVVTRHARGDHKCDGSGLDIEKIERADRELLWQQIHAIESRLGLPLTSRYRYPNIKASRQYWTELIAWQVADGTAVNTTANEAILYPNLTIPGGYMADGRTLRLMFKGKWGTHSSGTVTHVYRVRWNGVAGTLLAGTGTVTLVISITNALFEIDVELQTRTNGASGTIMANGNAQVYAATAPTVGSATGAPALAPLTVGGQTGPAASAAIDLTVDTPLSITIQHGASQAANTATGLQYDILSKN